MARQVPASISGLEGGLTDSASQGIGLRVVKNGNQRIEETGHVYQRE